MFSRIMGGRGKQTFKPMKSHKSKKRQELSTMKRTTLGTGSMLATVVLPAGESLDEWLAVHVVDFYNDVSLMYGLVSEDAASLFTKAGEGFPPGFEYRWSSGKGVVRCTGAEYVDYCMTWVDAQISNEEVFPTLADQPFADDFADHVKLIMKRIFRVFAIIYGQEPLFDIFASVEAAPHLNTSFKHFIYFALEFGLVGSAEFKAIPKKMQEMNGEYKQAKAEMEAGGGEAKE